MSYVNKLQKLGFTEKEARVYMACLKTGHARVAAIAHEANLPKSSTLDTLFTLNERGMVSRVRQKNRYTFAPTDPSVIGSWLERRVELFNDLLPRLEAMQYQHHKDTATKIFEGPRSLPSIWEHIIRSTHEVYIVIGPITTEDTLYDALTWFTKERTKHKLPARALLAETSTLKTTTPALAFSECRIGTLPHLTNGLLIIWNSGYVSISNEPVQALLIENETAANITKNLFTTAWQQAVQMTTQ
jgi:sugar-specific transcriptional regulator TrmB